MYLCLLLTFILLHLFFSLHSFLIPSSIFLFLHPFSYSFIHFLCSFYLINFHSSFYKKRIYTKRSKLIEYFFYQFWLFVINSRIIYSYITIYIFFISYVHYIFLSIYCIYLVSDILYVNIYELALLLALQRNLCIFLEQLDFDVIF